MTPDLPFECNVPGIPVSHQGSPASRDAWKQKIREAVRATLPEGAWAMDVPVEVTIFFLSGDAMAGDLDNRVKPILDALTGPIYIDDRLVDRLVVQRFAPSDTCRIVNPSAALIAAIGAGEPIFYIRIDDDPHRSGLCDLRVNSRTVCARYLRAHLATERLYRRSRAEPATTSELSSGLPT